jgi:serine/threonine-protein kinase ULK2
VYIKKRGKLPTLDYRPFPGAEPIFWPHPKEGGLDDRVARCFLGQLGEHRWTVNTLKAPLV